MFCYSVLVIVMLICHAGTIGFCADENGAIVIPVYTAESNLNEEDVYNPNHPIWAQATSHPLHFHRTPPLYADGPFDDGDRPEAYAMLVQLKNQTMYLRLEWKDVTENRFDHGTQYPDGGESHIYKTHTNDTDQFGDAACLMLPKSRKPMATYPSMMMGDAGNPVDLFFWQAGRGFSLLQAHGRASTARTEQELYGKSFRNVDGWTVIFKVPEISNSTPLCFALWDGAKQQRDGLKYYSLWYEAQFQN